MRIASQATGFYDSSAACSWRNPGATSPCGWVAGSGWVSVDPRGPPRVVATSPAAGAVVPVSVLLTVRGVWHPALHTINRVRAAPLAAFPPPFDASLTRRPSSLQRTLPFLTLAFDRNVTWGWGPGWRGRVELMDQNATDTAWMAWVRRL
jgi:hypothetical protein